MRILFLNPFHGGSHAAVAEGYARRSRHQVTLLSLSIAGGWRWRMRGAAVTLARRLRALPAERFDLIVTTDMLDLATFLGLTRDLTAGTPVALYMHENQLTYPLPPGRTRDLAFPWINYTAALAADALFFNSDFHRRAFLEALPGLPGRYHDHQELDLIDAIAARSEVLPPGIDLARLDVTHAGVGEALPPQPAPGVVGGAGASRPHPAEGAAARGVEESPSGHPAPGVAGGVGESFLQLTHHRPGAAGPVILWNSRWEYDKAPQAFFGALRELETRGVSFQVIVAGESVDPQEPSFAAARDWLAPRTLHWGYAPDLETYCRLLHRADIVVSTAVQEFFGIAVVEAMYCGCVPVLPRRLSYPELLPPQHHATCLYEDGALAERLQAVIADIETLRTRDFRAVAAPYDWSHMAPRYDAAFERVAGRAQARHVVQ
ncbi:MAG TPA: DUF3524 domain-containing protein [Roseiflexaceae bacterium]|nr:DUF3524 domain-containing protein [Roseiflexaceae bacterium]